MTEVSQTRQSGFILFLFVTSDTPGVPSPISSSCRSIASSINEVRGVSSVFKNVREIEE